MKKTVVVSGIIAICFVLGAITGAFGGVEPCPWTPLTHDLQLFQQELNPAQTKLGEAKLGADLVKLGLLKPHENMLTLLQTIRTKVKGLEGTKGQQRGVLDICNKMKPKLDSLELFLKNFSVAIKQGDKPTAQGLLNEMGETVKALEALIAK